MAYEMLTRTGRNFYEVTSVMQNSIRKGDYEIAGECCWELLPKYESYLRKRFLVISAEDCYGILTKDILNLCLLPGEENVVRALNVLCRAKKNRDADYFVCNLMGGDLQHEMNKEELAKGLTDSIMAMDVRRAGEYSYGLFKKNRKHLWKTLKEIARCTKPFLEAEFEALDKANETVTKPTEETIFAAKAIVLLWTKKTGPEQYLACPEMRLDGAMEAEGVRIIKPVDQCGRTTGVFPDWAYNWHTYRGKYKLRRDAIHAIANDQKLLTPLEENLFDDCSWNQDINACLTKWNPRGVQIPYDDGKLLPEEKFPGRVEKPDTGVDGSEAEQMSMFDLNMF